MIPTFGALSVYLHTHYEHQLIKEDQHDDTHQPGQRREMRRRLSSDCKEEKNAQVKKDARGKSFGVGVFAVNIATPHKEELLIKCLKKYK